MPDSCYHWHPWSKNKSADAMLASGCTLLTVSWRGWDRGSIKPFDGVWSVSAARVSGLESVQVSMAARDGASALEWAYPRWTQQGPENDMLMGRFVHSTDISWRPTMGCSRCWGQKWIGEESFPQESSIFIRGGSGWGVRIDDVWVTGSITEDQGAGSGWS